MSSKKHIEEEPAEENELWLISYADMMTLLFGFFVILYSFSQIDQGKLAKFGRDMAEALGAKVQEVLSESRIGIMSEARKARAFELLVTMLNLGTNVDEAVRKVEKKAQEGIQSDAAIESLKKSIMAKDTTGLFSSLKKAGKKDDATIDLALPYYALFAPGTDDLTPEAKKQLGMLAKEISKIEDVSSVEVIGHTDSRPPSKGGRFADNWALSSARAMSVGREIIMQGISKNAIQIVAAADSKPLFPEYSAKGQPILENMDKNRRVQIVIKKKEKIN